MADEVLSSEELAVLQGTPVDESSPLPDRATRSSPATVALDNPLPGSLPIEPAAAQPPRRDPSIDDRSRREVRHFRELAGLHQRLAHMFGVSLGELLRATVEVKVTSLGELTAGEFLDSLEAPTCLGVLRAGSDEARILVDLSPRVLYPIIDRLLGGGREPSSVIDRPMSPIEQRLAERTLRRFTHEYRAAWQLRPSAELAVERVESDPRAGSIAPVREIVVVLSFEIKLRDARGTMKICLPRPALDWLEANSAGSPSATGPVMAVPKGGDAWGQKSRRESITLIAQLATTKISADDLRALAVGDLITTEAPMQDGIVLCVDGVAKFRAHPGAAAGRKAARIAD